MNNLEYIKVRMPGQNRAFRKPGDPGGAENSLAGSERIGYDRGVVFQRHLDALFDLLKGVLASWKFFTGSDPSKNNIF